MSPADAAEACGQGTRLLAAVIRRYARLLRRGRRLDLILWTRPAGTPFYVATEVLYATTVDDLDRCRRVLARRYELTTARRLT